MIFPEKTGMKFHRTKFNGKKRRIDSRSCVEETGNFEPFLFFHSQILYDLPIFLSVPDEFHDGLLADNPGNEEDENNRTCDPENPLPSFRHALSTEPRPPL